MFERQWTLVHGLKLTEAIFFLYENVLLMYWIVWDYSNSEQEAKLENRKWRWKVVKLKSNFSLILGLLNRTLLLSNCSSSPAIYRKHCLTTTCLISPEVFVGRYRVSFQYFQVWYYLCFILIYVLTGWPWRQLWYCCPCLESRGYWVSYKLTLTQLLCLTPLFFSTACRWLELSTTFSFD